MAQKESIISGYLKSKKVSPIVAAFATGLYPLFFYYSNNYTLIGAWEHMVIFFTLYIATPLIVFLVVSRIIKIQFFKKIKPFALPFLNIFFFLTYLKIAIFAGLHLEIILAIFIIAVIIAVYLNKFFKKWIVIQLLLALIGFITLVPKVINQLNYSKEWLQQPDNILDATFEKKPNIYLIQPDGYVNFSELKKGKYNFDNTVFESYLQDQNFISYPDFRSNYAGTLATNSSLFAMKHHYYNDGASFSETTDARNVIISDNAVLTILKRNGYHTSFFSEHPYFFLNKPDLGYDKSNFTKKDVSIITTGMAIKRDVIADFENDSLISDVPSFTFIQIFNPTHITRTNSDTKGVEGERKHYLKGIETANSKIKKIITLINQRDPNAMIVIMADHGGFVGYEDTGQTYIKTDDMDLKRSVFSAIFSVKWPDNNRPPYDKMLKSPVNLFRILTAYLSNNPRYLDIIQDDGSYIILKDGVSKGVYRYIDEAGKSTLKKH